MKNFFITGTDTNVGKTIISSVLLCALKSCYWKPIQSGGSDLDTVKQLTGLSEKHFLPSIYSLKAPLSPDQAAQAENIQMDLEKIINPMTTQSLLVEGAGGILAPINRDHSMLHLMKKLNFPVVIVSRGTLGTINHTLLTIHHLRQAGVIIHGVIFNGELNPDNQQTIERWGNVRTLLHFPFFNTITPPFLKEWVAMNQHSILENFT